MGVSRKAGTDIGTFAASDRRQGARRYTVTVRSSQGSSQGLTPDGTRGVRILGIDYGRARMGLALADTVTGLARPLDTLVRINRNEDMRRLREIVREHEVRHIVVGLPLRLDGTRGEMAEEAERFARRIHRELGVIVEMVDERLTSWEAERLLEEKAGRSLHEAARRVHRKRRAAQPKASVDAIAAAVILEQYLEQQQNAKESI
jgi:putative holliday junction resolvase